MLGSGARAGVGSLLPDTPGSFPTGALIVNVTGSFLLGLYLARRERAAAGRWSLPFWAIGVLGSFTTFSAFSLDVVNLIAGSRPTTAAVYVVVSTVGGLMAALLGQRAGEVMR